MNDGSQHDRRLTKPIVALILATLLFRGIPILFGGVWYDELYTLKIASNTLRNLHFLSLFDVHPPLYYSFVHVCMQALQRLGDGFVGLGWLRLTSVIPGLLTIALLTCWGWRAWGRNAGLTIWAICILSPGLSYYSLELRSYSLLLLLIVAASMVLQSALRRPTFANWIGYILLSLLALHVHYQAVFILLAHFLWTFRELWRNRKTQRTLSRTAHYTMFLVIYILILPQLPTAAFKFNNVFRSTQENFPDIQIAELFTVFFYNFPGGWIDSQTFASAYGSLTIYLFVVLFIALIVALRRNRRPLPNPLSSQRLDVFALTIMIVYLVVTWTLSILEVGKFYSAARLSVLALPFWILFVVSLIERLGQPESRKWARLILFLALIPCAAISFVTRIQFHDHTIYLKTLGERKTAIQPKKKPPKQKKVYYLADSDICPWVYRVSPGISIRSFFDLVEDEKRVEKNLKVLTINLTELGLGTDEENLMRAFLHYWTRKMKNRIFYPVDFTCFELPADQYDSFREQYLSFRDANNKGHFRGLTSVHLKPQAHDFNRAIGFHDIEGVPKKIYRWTDGTHQVLYWQGPRLEGSYRLTVRFWRPYPLPSPRMEIKYYLPGDEQPHFITADTGEVIIEGDVHVTRSCQPLKFEMLSDYWIPALLDSKSRDQRRRGLLFLELDLRSSKR